MTTLYNIIVEAHLKLNTQFEIKCEVLNILFYFH